MNKPPAPVRVKLYGLFSVTRRGYYVLLGLGVVLLVAWLLVWGRIGPLDTNEAASPLARLGVWAWNNMAWIVLAAVLLELIEVWLVLRKFGREEAARRARESLG